MRRFGHRRGAAVVMLVGLCLLVAASLASAAWRWASAPRAWAAGEVPVAFWSWRTEAPTEEDVRRASRETGAGALFLRAGQFDLAEGRVTRVRAVEGRMPRGVELHLVYNGTRALLAEFGRVDEKILAAAVAETFRNDRERAARDGAMVRGLQLDFDSPTRLLARYARVLRAVREQLPPETRLSVTGLPTWMGAKELRDVLAAVDFWAPQFYGAEIPERFERPVPISSPSGVARDVERARKLGKPFYAGLAAYGHAIVYAEGGELVALRGDLDPSRVARGSDFELVERRAFERRATGDGAGDAALASEWRYVYRALADTVVDGLTVRAGERVVFDLPSGESLRASVRVVREGAGEKLLGILLFRLPTRGDATTLNVRQIAAALSDAEANADVSLRAEGGDGAATKDAAAAHHLLDAVPARDLHQQDFSQRHSQDQLVLTATNAGAAGAGFGEGALVLTIRVPRGGVRGVASLDGFDSFETLCGADGGRGVDEGGRVLSPCSPARAGFVRLKARGFESGAVAVARLSVEGELPSSLAVVLSMRVDDGRVWRRATALELSDR
ncbi:MAG TPA: DUF3142 domain-containing protein [Pyrinomonadaceae bacterium]|nr:DUF3142 domain-containing protein [Pyrinomonadaceae bacterium]